MKPNFLENIKDFILREKPFWFIVFVAVLFFLTLNPNWKPTWDSATYITLGKSLISGDGYKYMGYSHNKYPPVFPMLLASIIGIFGYNYFLMRLMIVIMGISSVGMAYWLCLHITNSTQICKAPYSSLSKKSMAVSVMLLSGVSYSLLFEATRILSDIPYMFFSFIALIFIYKYSRKKNTLNKTAYLTIIFILLAYFTRFVGISLIAGTIPYLFWRAKKDAKPSDSSITESPVTSQWWINSAIKVAFIGLIFFVFASAWIIRNQMLENLLPSELREALSYESEMISVRPDSPDSSVIGLKELYSRVKGNLDYYEVLMTNIISGKKIKSETGILIISLILLCGFIARAISNPTIIEFYVFFYFWIYLLWPSRQGERFLVPIIPFLFLYFLSFPKLIFDLIRYLLKYRQKLISIIRFSTIILVTVILFYFNLFPAIDVIKAEHQKPYYGGGTANYISAIHWIKENTPSDSIVVTDRAPWVYLLSGRKTFTFPWIPDTQKVIGFIRKNDVTHIIYVPWGYSKSYLKPTISDYQDEFTEIHRIDNIIIYKFKLK